MFQIRGKTKSGKSITGSSDANTPQEAVAAVSTAVKKAGDEIVQVSVKSVEGSAGIKIAAPRKRKAAK